jgi:3'-phosphoadenosine 5'-phosphosulfate sulfotransferase (PAPS reductase)/FAD synthetase
MKEKIEVAKELIGMALKNYRNPIINSGFGKDSICVVHLCRSMGLNLDIMFHRDPYFPKKYRYANKIIDMWNLVCRDYPARSTSVYFRYNTFEVCRHFQIGYSDLVLCAMLYTPDKFIDGEYLCAYKDVYLQPLGTYNYIWDVIIEGHRTKEAKPHNGMVPSGLSWENKHNIGSADAVFPIQDWTNQEVYQYIVENGIPINTDVYDVKDGELVPKIDPATGQIDSTYNPDRRPACFECMRPDNPRSVLCPKKMCRVNNNWEYLVKTQMPSDFPGYREEETKAE